MGSQVDWTQVLVALVAGLPSIVAAYFSYRIALNLRTPSGSKPGTLIEQTHELAIVNTELTKNVHERVAHEAPPHNPQEG